MIWRSATGRRRAIPISDRASLLFLVDTNVISAAALGRAALTPELTAWLTARSDELYLSAITITEIVDGVAKRRREGATRRAAMLANWLDDLLHFYGGRILAFDADVARQAGILTDLARGKGQQPGFADIAIAATASRHGLTLLTRNVRHFAFLDLAVIDPFVAQP